MSDTYYAPNTVEVNAAMPSAWRIIASDGTLHASMADLLNAGKKPWPGLDPGGFLLCCDVIGFNTTNNVESAPFYVAVNTDSATDAKAIPVGFSGAKRLSLPTPIKTLWVRAAGTPPSGDRIYAIGRY